MGLLPWFIAIVLLTSCFGPWGEKGRAQRCRYINKFLEGQSLRAAFSRNSHSWKTSPRGYKVLLASNADWTSKVQEKSKAASLLFQGSTVLSRAGWPPYSEYTPSKSFLGGIYFYLLTLIWCPDASQALPLPLWNQMESRKRAVTYILMTLHLSEWSLPAFSCVR